MATYPKDHKVGMVVPIGGSDCAKCEYLSKDSLHCENEHFTAWLGSSKLPAKADRYCCDFFEAGKKKGLVGRIAALKAGGKLGGTRKQPHQPQA